MPIDGAVIEQWFRNRSAEHLPNHIITQLNEIGNPDNFISQLLIEALIFDVGLDSFRFLVVLNSIELNHEFQPFASIVRPYASA